MRRTTAGILPALTLVLATGSSGAYTRSTVSATDGGGIAWDLANHDTYVPEINDGILLYRLHAAGSADVGNGDDLAAVARAFRTWSGISTSALRFQRDQDTTNMTTMDDGEFAIFWNETSTVVDQGTPATDDDVNIAGALAVAFVYRVVSGPETGEIRDANIVFNGADFVWTASADPEAGRYDIESVALHEIGHTLGLGHSPVAAASLFPRLGAGSRLARKLSSDDIAGVTAIYPGGNSAANRGTITGVVSNGAPVLGALVWARDSAGGLLAHATSDADGVYLMAGLPPGPVTLHTEPVNDASGFSLFSAANMGPYYAGAQRDFRYTGDLAVDIPAGDTVIADLEPAAGTPTMEIKLLSRSGSWSNIRTFLRRGQSGIRIGVAGPGLPLTGTPLSISGTDITVESTTFDRVAGLPAVEITVTVAADASLGARDLVISAGGETTVALGAVDILHASEPLQPPVTFGVKTEVVGPGLDLAWEPSAGTSWYRLYRGNLATLRSGDYDHAVVPDGCYLSAPQASLMDDIDSPVAFYYLVNSVAENETVGPDGTASSSMPRPAGFDTCP
ncbi:MAG: matrixin family metalloprotease [Acidobacteria bacterium]|nr:matrixin family metalloprotease [Acidobacteriota bacterium]